MGFTGFSTDDHVNTWITPNSTPEWAWTNPLNPSHSYKNKVSCLFNFNNVHLNQSSTNDDIKFSIQVNDSNWANFYHTKSVDHPMYHSVDLATHTVLSASGGYNDAPGATNTLRLRLDTNAGANFALCDGCDNYPCPSQCIGGRVNLYRVYQTEPLNGENTITTYQTTGGQITPNNPQVWAYESKTFSIVPNTNYVISSVYVDGEYKGVISNYTFDSVTRGHTITANFIRQFHVTLQPSVDGIITGPATVDQGSDPQYTVTAYCGSIAHVYLDYGTGYQQDLGAHSSPYTFNPFPNISGDHTITAVFSTVPGLYSVGFDADHDTVGDMLTPEPCTFVVDGVSYAPDANGNYGTACLTSGKHSFTAVPPYIHDAYNYHPLVHLEYGSNTYTCNPAVIDINSSNVVRALYTTIPDEPSHCTITVSAGAHGTVYHNPETHTIQVLQGGCATFKITPATGYQLQTLQYNTTDIKNNVVNGVITFDVQGGGTLTASFSSITYTITASVSGGGGSISPSGIVTVNHGSNSTFTLTPNTGYHIADLIRNPGASVLNSVVNNQYTANNITANFTLTASFSNQYKITASAGYGGSISPSGQVYVNQGSTPTFYITPDGYFQISSVYVNGSYIGQVTSYTFPSVQTDNQTISATFEVNCQECYACYVFCQGCQDTCEINCQTGCEVTCQTGCQVSCQSCNTCQTTCELACQTGCQVSCQTGCEVNCQTGCQVSCQSCNTCQTTCELACQTGCQVSCQTGCEVSCQECNTCQTCQLGCQTGCQVSCQSACELSCQGCQGCNTCQDACQSLCQSCYICQPVCNWCQNCMIGY